MIGLLRDLAFGAFRAREVCFEMCLKLARTLCLSLAANVFPNARFHSKNSKTVRGSSKMEEDLKLNMLL